MSESTGRDLEDNLETEMVTFPNISIKFDICKAVIFTDIVLTIAMFILLLLESSEKFSEPTSLALAQITRIYLKLPFAYCLFLHHLKLKRIQ